jgi:hypothetical protein
MISNPRKINGISPWTFLLPVLLLGLLAAWVISNHYLNDSALLRWSKLLTVLDASEVHLEYIGMMHPHVPIYLLAPFYYLPGLATPAAPYLLSVLSGGLLLMIWNYHLRLKRYGAAARGLLLLLAGLNPLFLWTVSSGSEKALSLLMYYLFCFAILRTLLQMDARSIIMLAATLVGYFFVDERTFFLAVAFFPLIPMVAPPTMLRESPLSVFFVIILPLMLAIGSWFYLNWVFHGDAQTFLTVTDSSFLGARLDSGESLWLRSVGGTWMMPTLLSLGLALISFPSLLWQASVVWHSSRLRNGVLVFLLVPVLAMGVASGGFFIAHPAEMLFLLCAGSMAGLLLLPRANRRQKTLAAGMLLLGDLVAAGWFMGYPSVDMLKWRQAISGQDQDVPQEMDRGLGHWLAENRLPTLIADRAGYRAIAARGDSKGLLLSFMPEFKLALQRADPGVAQVVVINPSHERAYADRVTRQYPDLYRNGLPGYRLVFQNPHWHVYRRWEADQ